MAYDKITLNIRRTTIDGIDPTFVKVKVYPMATNTTTLKQIKDTAGNVVMRGHVEKYVTTSTALVQVDLPDPRDVTLDPAEFGYKVLVGTNFHTDSSTDAVVFGATEITAFAIGGVLELEDVTPSDPAAFQALPTTGGGGAAGFFRGPTAPTPPAGSGEYLWFQTDGAGGLVDILSGVA